MLYSILKSFLIPPGIIILMLVAAFLLSRGVLARLLIFVALSILTLLSLPVVGISLIAPFESDAAIDLTAASTYSDAQAIVILGGGRRKSAPEYGGDTLDDSSLRRVRYGALLHRASGLPVYVTGGNLTGEDVGVGALMAEVLDADYDIEVAAAETHSRTTWENAAYTAPVLQHDGIVRILLVSDAWHLPRAAEAFVQAGFKVIPAPTAFEHRPGWMKETTYRDWLPSAGAFLLSSVAIHEHLGRVWYQMRVWTQGAPGSTNL